MTDEVERPLSERELELLEELGDRAWEGITLLQWKRLIREVRRGKHTHPPYTTCAECADTIEVDKARHGPGGYCWCSRCFEAIECGDSACHGHKTHPCEECGRRW